MNDMRSLLRFGKPYLKQAVFSLVMLLAVVVLDLSIPRFVQRLIDQGIQKKDLQVVLGTSGLMIAASLLSMVAAVLNSNSSIRVGEGVGRDLREAIFGKIQSFSHANLDNFPTGRLMVRLTSDTAAVQRLFQVSLRIGTRAPLSMILSIVLMFVTSGSLALSMLPLLVASWIIIGVFSYRMEPLFRKAQQKLDRLNTVLQENIAGARLVKSFVREERESERFGEANADFAEGTIRVAEIMSVMSPLLTMLINIGMVSVVWLGGGQAIKGSLSVGQIVAFVNYLLATMNPLIVMTNLANTWANGLASAKRIREVLDASPAVAPPQAPVFLPDRPGRSVSFRGVDFHYAGSSDFAVLEKIDLDAESGQTIAILGATGSGKSTLVNLVPRFYDASAGTVRIDGIDVKEIAEDSLSGAVGMVPQETILFTGTIRDNIRYGHPDAGEEEVAAAAKAAQAHDFIIRMPLGYDTMVGERGATLSGGQKQRLAIARAIISRPGILILDDSTSSVDVETESRIQRALPEFLKGSTIIIVAQRISTVLNADRILVMDQGRVAAAGTHRELLRSSPIYREIYDSQLGGGPDNGNR